MRFMLLQDYAPTEVTREWIGAWRPEDAAAHIEFQREMNARLIESGELVEAQALTEPQLAKVVVHDGVGAPVVTDGPFPEGKELLAGYRIVDVESLERAIEIAADASAAPGPGNKPIKQPIEVRELMGAPMPEQ
jgi:hypothetical protein